MIVVLLLVLVPLNSVLSIVPSMISTAVSVSPL